jgi:hypothetical protein
VAELNQSEFIRGFCRAGLTEPISLPFSTNRSIGPCTTGDIYPGYISVNALVVLTIMPDHPAAECSSSSHDDNSFIQDASADEPHDSGANRAINLEKQTTASSTASALNQRAQSIISRIRSRERGQVAKFTHPLSHTKTSPEVLVDFDGPDDPYHPRNWGFYKKCVTTVLYGLTTMGMAIFVAFSLFLILAL